MLHRHKPLLLIACRGIVFSVWFNNFDQTMGYYWSYTLLYSSHPFLCTFGMTKVAKLDLDFCTNKKKKQKKKKLFISNVNSHSSIFFAKIIFSTNSRKFLPQKFPAIQLVWCEISVLDQRDQVYSQKALAIVSEIWAAWTHVRTMLIQVINVKGNYSTLSPYSLICFWFLIRTGRNQVKHYNKVY